jgi:hypothetical protein
MIQQSLQKVLVFFADLRRTRLSEFMKLLIVAVIISFIIAYLLPPYWNIVSLTPLYILFLRNEQNKTLEVYLSIALLMFLWQLCLCFCFAPLYYLLGKYAVLLGYSPIFFIASYYRQPSESVPKSVLIFQMIAWDSPLMLWMYIMSKFGRRVMKVSRCLYLLQDIIHYLCIVAVLLANH